MPVLWAKGEAEALSTQLNNEGHVDACITADTNAFLFGAKTVIKVLKSNCKEPFECYNRADIEAGLGLNKKQMVAMALLIGSDHDLHGVPGIGLEIALRFVHPHTTSATPFYVQMTPALAHYCPRFGSIPNRSIPDGFLLL
ncbi:unnamed protein product [Urochloa humidicola]